MNKMKPTAAGAKRQTPPTPVEEPRQLSPSHLSPLTVGFSESKAALLESSEAFAGDNAREETASSYTFQDILSFGAQLPVSIVADEFYGPWQKYHELVGKATVPVPVSGLDDPWASNQTHAGRLPDSTQKSPETQNSIEPPLKTFANSAQYIEYMKSLFARTSEHDRQKNFRFYLFCTGIAPLLAFCFRALYEDGKHTQKWTKQPVIFLFSWFMTLSNLERWPPETWQRLPLTAFDERLHLVRRQNDVLRTKQVILTKRISQLQRIKEKITSRNQRIAAERAEAVSPVSEFGEDEEFTANGTGGKRGAGAGKGGAANKHNKTGAKGGKADARLSGIHTAPASGAGSSGTAGAKGVSAATGGAAASSQKKGAVPSSAPGAANLTASAATAKGGGSATSTTQPAKGAKPETAAKKKK